MRRETMEGRGGKKKEGRQAHAQGNDLVEYAHQVPDETATAKSKGETT
jgi:hypothetical protein